MSVKRVVSRLRAQDGQYAILGIGFLTVMLVAVFALFGLSQMHVLRAQVQAAADAAASSAAIAGGQIVILTDSSGLPKQCLPKIMYPIDAQRIGTQTIQQNDQTWASSTLSPRLDGDPKFTVVADPSIPGGTAEQVTIRVSYTIPIFGTVLPRAYMTESATGVVGAEPGKCPNM